MDSRHGIDGRNSHRYLRQIVKIFLVFFVLLAGYFCYKQANWSNYFAIKHVRIYGVTRLDQQEVQQLLLPLVQNNYFNVNLTRIRLRLQQLPWISNLTVRRVWPDQIEITVIEKSAAANWNHTGLVSTNGEVFVPRLNTYPENLPQFVGPGGKQIVMLQYYNQINRILSPIHVKISYLEMTPYLTWKLALNNGISLQVGEDDILTRLAHFVKVYPKIVGDHPDQVEYVDLRYSNGMAVRFKSHTMNA